MDHATMTGSSVRPESFTRFRSALADRYRIESEAGRGGMATVYLAHDLKHGRRVAVKVLHQDYAHAIGAERFLREIETAARLQHPHIVAVYDSGEAAGLLYYVMPYVEGETLRDRMNKEKQLSIEEAVQIARDVAKGLAYAHIHDVVHRDIKPENILLGGSNASVADFGIAKAIHSAGQTKLTSSGLSAGTPAYMSPEQAGGDSDIDGRADVYSLGCMLFEMLAGVPPYHGVNAQAVLTRHMTDAPPRIRSFRNSAPPALERVLIRAMAKVPADRYTTAGEFEAAMVAALAAPGELPPASPSGKRLAVAAAVVILGASFVWYLFSARGKELDPNRIVVFPLQDIRGDKSEGAGDAIATLIGYALEGTSPLKWLEGSDLLDAAQRAAPDLPPMRTLQTLASRQRAGFFIDGSIVRSGDSATVILRLHDVRGDSLVARAGSSAALATAGLPTLGLRAVRDLLPRLLAPGRKLDVTALSDRAPAAVANFLQGERAYRRSHFSEALDLYRAAVAADSSLAIAAVKGAQAASWLLQSEHATKLVGTALGSEHLLPRRHVYFARGLARYYSGEADSAVHNFEVALEIDSSWSEAWMALGEVYHHLLPNRPARDSLALEAFSEARRRDPEFTPPLYHLAEIALRKGDVRRAESLIMQLSASDPDSVLSRNLDILAHCVRDGPGRLDWEALARERPRDLLSAGKFFSAGGNYSACARHALWALLNDPRPELRNERWSAMLALQGLLIATGQDADVVRLVNSPVAAGMPANRLLILHAAAGVNVRGQAAEVAASLGEDFPSMSGPNLNLLTLWEVLQGRADRVRMIARVLTSKADSSRSRRDSLLAAVSTSYAALADADTLEALRRLSRLHPTARSTELEWLPWESLGSERMAVASLLLAKGDLKGAYRTASELDSHQPVIYLVHLRSSLSLRARAADLMGDKTLATRHRERLTKLSRDTFPNPWRTSHSP